MQLPGKEGDEFFFGFGKQPAVNWRTADASPLPSATMSSLLGFPTADLDLPQDSPQILIRYARRHAASAPELSAAVETAVGMPDYIPAELTAQAWRLAHQIAAGAAVEHPEASVPLQRIARGALRYARKYAKAGTTRETTKGLVPEEITVSGNAASEVSMPPSEPPTGTTATTDKPIRRWRDSRGYVHSPNAPSPECRELPPGPKGGRIWDCGGDVETPKNGQPSEEDVTSQQQTAVSGDAVAAALQAIKTVRANPTPEGVAELAKLLSTMSGEDMAAVREEAANDTPEAAKVAHAARTRIVQREHWLQLAANAKVDAEQALLTASDMRKNFHVATGSRVPFAVSLKLAIESLAGSRA